MKVSGNREMSDLLTFSSASDIFVISLNLFENLSKEKNLDIPGVAQVKVKTTVTL